MNNQRGFIQIPLLLLIVFVALMATGGGYYAIKHTPQSAKQNAIIEEKNKTATTSAEVATNATSTQPSTNNPFSDAFNNTSKDETPSSDNPFLNALKQNNASKQPKESERKPLDLPDRSTSVTNNIEQSAKIEPVIQEENEPKLDILAIMGKLLEQLGADTEDLSALLENVQYGREQWIKLAEDTADSRSRSLDTLADGITIQNIKQFIVDTAGHYRQDRESARSTYSGFYKPLEDAIVAQTQKTTAIKDELWNGGLPSDDLQNRAKELLLENNDQKTRFLNLTQKFNDGNYSLENKKSDIFIEILNNIRTLLSSYATVLSVNQQLLEIEQEARTRTLPKTEIRCWATTQYSGGIVNGTSQTSIRCE